MPDVLYLYKNLWLYTSISPPVSSCRGQGKFTLPRGVHNTTAVNSSKVYFEFFNIKRKESCQLFR